MTEDTTKLTGADAVQVTQSDAVDEPLSHRSTLERNLQLRKEHLAELEKRVKRTDYSQAKMAQYRAALARASAEVKEITREIAHGHD